MSETPSVQSDSRNQQPEIRIPFRLREARRADVETVVLLWRELMALHTALDVRFAVTPDGENVYRRHIEDMVRSRDGRVILAEAAESGEAVGFIQGELLPRSGIAPPGFYGLISDLFVREAWRRHGVGRALFEEMRRWFADRKVQTIQLYVAAANPDALAFWEAVGMRLYMHVLQQDIPLPEDSDASGEETSPKWLGLFGTKSREQGG